MEDAEKPTHKKLCGKVTRDQPGVSKSEMECEDEAVLERKVGCETGSSCEVKKGESVRRELES